MKRLAVFAVFISVVTLVGFWGGKKACMLMWPGSVNPSQGWRLALGLTDDQARQLGEIEKSFHKEADPLCMQICRERLELLKLMSQSSVDPNAVHAKIDRIGGLQVLLEKQIASHILEVKKDLTPKQSQNYLNRIRRELYESICQSGYGQILPP